jgi:hypothetical protein
MRPVGRLPVRFGENPRVEILWPALGVSAIVCVAFCAVAARWQRILRQQSRTVRALSGRVRASRK